MLLRNNGVVVEVFLLWHHMILYKIVILRLNYFNMGCCRQIFLVVTFFVIGVVGYSQAKISTEQYIAMYKDIAMDKMREYKIPASITLAQGILESGSGNSSLARNANNHFGIKCHKGWTGESVTMDDDEKNECFRKYPTAEESYRDHSVFLTTRPRYEGLFTLDIMDYKAWAKGLKAAGYATNPRYPDLLIAIVERYDLARYDQEAMSGKKGKKVKIEVYEPSALDEQPYAPEDKSIFAVVDKTPNGRFIYENNGVKFVYAHEGETIYALAEDLGVYSRQILKYNYLEHNADVVFSYGDLVYIEPLKNRNKHCPLYVVPDEMTLREVSLRFGVKMNKLQRYNKFDGTVRLSKGTEVKLRRGGR